MQIRTKLTLQFLFIGGAIMVIASCAIYFSSAQFRKEDFYRRLENKAINTAKLLIEVDEIDASLLRRIERDNPVNLPEEKIIILDYKNDTLYSSDEEGTIRIEKEIVDQIRLDGRFFYRQGSYEIIGLLYSERFDRFTVLAAAIDITGVSKLKNLRIILSIVCLASILIFSVAGWIYAGKALAPISGVVKQVEDISIQSLNLRLDEGTENDEISKLTRTFNKMLDRLEEAFQLQKDFISNASHEIRTPLTSVYGQLQVLLLRERSVPDYKMAITSVVEDIRNLTDLVNSLLLLARASAETTDRNIKILRLDDILWQVTDELKKANEEFRINIRMDDSLYSGDADKMTVNGNEYLLKVAISNILENACKFSDDHTADVFITGRDKMVVVEFSDRGRGIPEKDLVLIFEPFYRASNAKTVPGHGIGLSLVHKIVRNHNGSVDIVSEAGMGTTVTVKLPSA
jgi:signal transduction histidine kinase